MTYEQALIIAAGAHEGQHYGSDPYVLHPIRVAARVSGDAVLVALLHDVIENTDLTIVDLLEKEVPWDVAHAVDILSRDEAETYAEYIERVAIAGDRCGRLARLVKRADLEENMSNLNALGPDVRTGLRRRYAEALNRLDEAEAN